MTADEDQTPRGKPRGAADRVRLSQRQVRWTTPLIALFAAAGVSAAVIGSRWATVHLLLAGATVLLISAVSMMLTVTWSAAPAPADAAVAVQRVTVTMGVAVLVAGHQSGAPTWVALLGAAAYAAGLLLLAWQLVSTVRRGVERRYDVPVAGYAVAIVAGTVGAALGADLLTGAPVEVRDAHRVLNLLGLVGIVIAATLPFYVATVGRSKMSKAATPARLIAILAVQGVSVVVVVIGLLTSTTPAAVVGLLAYAVCVGTTVALLPRPTRRQLDWAGPRLYGMWCGAAWWIVSVVVAAVQVADGSSPLADPWLVLLTVVAYGQIIWGSLAYLLPVVRGGGHKLLSAGFRLTRSWLGLVAVNLVGIALLAGLGAVAAAAAAVWVTDAAVRFALLLRRPAGASPDEATTAGSRSPQGG
ncbi:MAG: hypothetical protein JST64_00790 [Actinobacteria bacterium]|nr:hypothetical protein [Actinomycetota bacterium]